MYITYKELGETPLERLEKLRIEKGINANIPMTYAGRLDPMAEGMLIILVGDECKEKDKYLGLDKEYEVEVLLGVQTDSYDVLGLIGQVNSGSIDLDFKKYIGKFTQEYPKYSSKMLAMKEVPDEIPTKIVEIYSIEEIGEKQVKGGEIVKEVIGKIRKVNGEFRQDKIIAKWKIFGEENAVKVFKIVKLKVFCSSGTYMRSLAYSLGGLAYSIKRTKVGQYDKIEL